MLARYRSFDTMDTNLCFSVLLPFVQYFIFAIKNVVLAIGRNPVSWLRHQLIDVIRIRREIGVSVISSSRERNTSKTVDR